MFVGKWISFATFDDAQTIAIQVEEVTMLVNSPTFSYIHTNVSKISTLFSL